MTSVNEISTQVRTRFAPSPTGYLHIGGARTAIFNWLFARRHNGVFVLRIEDTDRSRSTDESIDQIIEAMSWLGLDHDEGPYRQTERQDIYLKYVYQLLDDGAAYRCVCSKEILDAKRQEAQKAGKKPKYDGTCRGKEITADCKEPFVVRFKTPQEGVTEVEDLLRGTVKFNNNELDDMIILRADGTPTYNFCVVIDDADMKISHVIRGDDHLNNTPRQAVIYKALGFEMPKFIHVSMILGKDGKRLSKRHGALSVLEYRDNGILPDALVNYLVRLGWSHGDREVFTLDELKTLFDLDAITKSAARFDDEKLLWINSEHIKTGDDNKLGSLVADALKARNINATPADILPLLPMLKERSKTIIDLADGMKYFFADKIDYDEKAAKKFLTESVAPAFKELADRLNALDFSDKEKIESCFRELVDEKGMKLKDLAQPMRVALTGGTVSPGLFDVMTALGKEKCINRVHDAIRFIEGE